MVSPIFVLAMLAGSALSSELTFTAGGKTGCINLSHLQALGQTYEVLNVNKTEANNFVVPHIPDTYLNSPSDCIPESLYDKFFEPIVALSKKEELLANLDAVLALDVVATSVQSIHQRARNCPQIKDAAIAKANSLSCNSAPHPNACRSCANFSAVNFAVACVACAAKANQESIFCCAAAATTFATYYSQVCLEK
ncbi:hypothetical protein EDB81DRAFT_769426 [Dactylonectria macrodidyma]|uniref:Uncharacterized protein n=1 Tax=Dactylonectria macrodidyma TaxID=307937 RepID=A0A9P9FS16_9HYPO|nr:hypothetical protein EDB81DRAFT_769426 [Dactylonectria macrodidyma]